MQLFAVSSQTISQENGSLLYTQTLLMLQYLRTISLVAQPDICEPSIFMAPTDFYGHNLALRWLK